MDRASRTPKQLGAALRRYRKAHGLIQGDLGAKINKRQATISALEAGEGKPATLLAVLAAIDLELVIRPRTKSNVAGLGEIF